MLLLCFCSKRKRVWFLQAHIFKKTVVSSWRNYGHLVLVNRLGGLSLPKNSVVRFYDRLDMTITVYRRLHNNNDNNKRIGIPTLMQRHCIDSDAACFKGCQPDCRYWDKQRLDENRKSTWPAPGLPVEMVFKEDHIWSIRKFLLFVWKWYDCRQLFISKINLYSCFYLKNVNKLWSLLKQL